MNKGEQFHDYYGAQLGRNIYSQDLRQYEYTPYNGQFYGDCSASGCSVYEKMGVKASDNGYYWNTASMHYNGRKLDVTIVDGHIAKGLDKLRVGDALMFRGNDASRPLQIGHVEYVFEINGDSEDEIVICGHGSGRPSLKNMRTYLTQRQAAKASNGKPKGLVEVLRFFDADEEGKRPTIKRGYKDLIQGCEYCRELQDDLNKLGYRQDTSLDGSCGPACEEMIKAFQVYAKDVGWYSGEIDGKCGQGTWKAIDRALGELTIYVPEDIIILEGCYSYDKVQNGYYHLTSPDVWLKI